MHPREHPSDKQLRRRLRRAPTHEKDYRYQTDPYWILRAKGYSDAQAKRAFRKEPPVRIRTMCTAPAGVDPEDILFMIGVEYEEISVSLRPTLAPETILSLEPRLVEYVVWDIKVPGFGVRVRTTGYKTYILMYRDPTNAILRKKTFGNTDSLNLEDARALARDYRLAVFHPQTKCSLE